MNVPINRLIYGLIGNRVYTLFTDLTVKLMYKFLPLTEVNDAGSNIKAIVSY